MTIHPLYDRIVPSLNMIPTKFQIFLLALAGGLGPAIAEPSIPLAELLKLPPEEVPAQVRVTEMLDPYDRIVLDGHARILEKLPEDWESTGQIGMTDRYSRAGKKSVRWDWQGGDTIRIKDLGVLSTLRYRNSRAHNSARYLPLELSCLVEQDLPKNTEFLNLFVIRPEADGTPKLVRFRYFLTYGRTWVVLGQGDFDSGLGEIIEEMPDGLAPPEPHELVIRIPKLLERGTYYLDRLLTVAQLPYREMLNNGQYLPHPYTERYDMIDDKAVPISTFNVTLGNPSFVPAQPIDPTTLTIHSEGYEGYFAAKPPLPETLTPAQTAFLEGERTSVFGERIKPLAPDSDPYPAHLEKVRGALAKYCTQRPDGSYRFKESFNFSGPRVWFRGDRFHHRKHHLHIPKEYRDQGVSAPHVLRECSELFMKSPDEAEAQQLFRAAVAWFRQQVSNPPAYIVFSGKYGADFFRGYFGKLIPLLNHRGEEFREEADYLSSLMMFAGKAYSAAWHKKQNSANSLELGHALNIYESLMYEPDDRVLYAMLENFRDNWKMYYGISVWGRSWMIKPDYTFFHHGELSYWGNISGYTRIGEVFANKELDFEPETHRTIANHISRYTFGALPLETIKGGQEHNWGKYMTVKEPSRPSRGKSDLGGVTEAPRGYLFDYLYDLDWGKVPAAKKYVAGVLGNASYQSEEVQKRLVERYPKLEGLAPQRDIHFSLNWTGASAHTHGRSTVYALGAKNITQWRGGTPLRRYGTLVIGSRFGKRPLGATQHGYSWVRVPGNTMPALTEQEWIDMQDEKSTGGSAYVKFGVTPVPGNGSLTFHETDESFSRSGNFALKIDEPEKSPWDRFSVARLQGQKSYHFHGDTVVCLGSGYRAETDRSMRTVLLQEMVGEVPWSHRDRERWDTGTPQIVVNGEVHQDDFTKEIPLIEPNYLISPYGHAWILAGGQQGRLRLAWKERETLYKWRFNKAGSIQPGQEITKGTGVIASLEQDSGTPSSHHCSVLLNSGGKSPEAFEAQVKERMKSPRYQVLRHDKSAHAVEFQSADRPLYSCLVFEPGTELDLPFIASASKRVNLMYQQKGNGQLVLSVCDPEIAFSKGKYGGQVTDQISATREVRIVLDRKLRLVAAHSGLPQANPALEARIETGAETSTLRFQTSNAVTDTFVLEVVP